MTNLIDAVATERSADLSEEAATERPGGFAQMWSSRRRARRRSTRREGSLARALSSHDMPHKEIRAVLRARDPIVVARYMELHRERLAEQLALRVLELEALERILAGRSRVATPRR